MNSRQRRGVLLMAVAALGAVAVFFTVLSYVSGVSRQVGPQVTSFQFARDMPRYTAVSRADLVEVKVPQRWMSSATVRSFDPTRGLVTTSDVKKGSTLQDGMVGPPPELKPGQRELAILIDAETGVAGKIHSGDLVDIYATFTDQKDAQARVLVSNARVLAIGQLQQAASTGTGGQRFTESQVVPVTFALGVEDSLKLTYAESFATRVRLALVAPGTTSPVDPNAAILRQQQLLAAAPVGP